MKVALITEGTYPFAHGGVSVWCDHLVRELDDVDFSVYAITGLPHQQSVWALPSNITNLTHVDLEATEAKPFGSRMPADQRSFLEAFESFVDALLADPMEASTDFLFALRGLFNVSKTVPLDIGIRSDEAFEILRKKWIARYVGDRFDELGNPTLLDVLDATSTLAMYLKLLHIVPEGDVAHTTAGGLSSLIAMAGKWGRGMPCVLTEHGVYIRERYLESGKSPQPDRLKALQLLFFRHLNRAALQTADLIAPVSDYNRRWELQSGADSGQIHTVYNGVHPERFPILTEEPEVPTITWVGRIDPLKDVKTLVTAFIRVKRAVPAAQLRLYGPVPQGNELYHEEILEVVRESSVGDSIIFEGLIRDVALAHQAGSVVALSSISEGFPFTVLEAMMSGRATVSTDVGGVGEAVGDTGLLVPPRDPDAFADALGRVLSDDLLRRRLGKNAAKRARELFAMERMTTAYQGMYATVLNLIDSRDRDPSSPTAVAASSDADTTGASASWRSET